MAKDSPSSWFVKDCLDFIANCESLCRLTSRTRKNQVPNHRSSLCIPFLRACFISKPTNSKPEQINSNCPVIITWGPASLSQLGGDSKRPHLMRFSFVPALSVPSWLHQEHHHQPSNLQGAKLTFSQWPFLSSALLQGLPSYLPHFHAGNSHSWQKWDHFQKNQYFKSRAFHNLKLWGLMLKGIQGISGKRGDLQ